MKRYKIHGYYKAELETWLRKGGKAIDRPFPITPTWAYAESHLEAAQTAEKQIPGIVVIETIEMETTADHNSTI